jgi:hypothetical protein
MCSTIVNLIVLLRARANIKKTSPRRSLGACLCVGVMRLQIKCTTTASICQSCVKFGTEAVNFFSKLDIRCGITAKRRGKLDKCAISSNIALLRMMVTVMFAPSSNRFHAIFASPRPKRHTLSTRHSDQEWRSFSLQRT